MLQSLKFRDYNGHKVFCKIKKEGVRM